MLSDKIQKPTSLSTWLEHHIFYCDNTKVFWDRVNKWFMTVTQVKF